jgi:hypothetical protein
MRATGGVEDAPPVVLKTLHSYCRNAKNRDQPSKRAVFPCLAFFAVPGYGKLHYATKYLRGSLRPGFLLINCRLVLPFLSFPCLSLVLAGSRELSKREECRLFLCLSAVSFLGASFPGQAAPDGRSGSCFRRRSGSCFRRRSGSSFRRAPCFRRRSCSSSRRMLLCHAFCLCLSPVASSPRSRALSSSASPVLLGF